MGVQILRISIESRFADIIEKEGSLETGWKLRKIARPLIIKCDLKHRSTVLPTYPAPISWRDNAPGPSIAPLR